MIERGRDFRRSQAGRDQAKRRSYTGAPSTQHRGGNRHHRLVVVEMTEADRELEAEIDAILFQNNPIVGG